MRACGADRKKLIAAPGDENLLAKCVSQKHFAASYLINFTALLEVGPVNFIRRFSHKRLVLSFSYAFSSADDNHRLNIRAVCGTLESHQAASLNCVLTKVSVNCEDPQQSCLRFCRSAGCA